MAGITGHHVSRQWDSIEDRGVAVGHSPRGVEPHLRIPAHQHRVDAIVAWGCAPGHADGMPAQGTHTHG